MGRRVVGEGYVVPLGLLPSPGVLLPPSHRDVVFTRWRSPCAAASRPCVRPLTPLRPPCALRTSITVWRRHIGTWSWSVEETHEETAV